MPGGHRIGKYNATHFTNVRCSGPLASLTGFCPIAMRKASLRWQII